MFFASNKHVIDAKRAEQSRRLAESAVAKGNTDHHAYLWATGAFNSTDDDPSDIVANIKQGKWTSSEVLEAYIQRAIKAHALTNCLTEILFDEARLQAKELDAEFAATNKIRGPLHGIPFSLKVGHRFYDSTAGFSEWANQPAAEHAVMVKQIIAAGGIPFVKTNVPQAMLTFECNNPLWGRSVNPYNPGYTCGGSSGGESALLALRIPPAYCGIYSLKPGFGRLSKEGARGPCPGFEGLRSVTGPMARSVKDLELFCRALFGSRETDTVYDITPLPYRDVSLPEKLKFGYYTSDGFIKASPATKRAVLETVEELRKQGHECIEFTPPSVHEAIAIYVSISSADAYKIMLSHLGPDPMARLRFISSFASWVLSTFFGDTKAAKVVTAAGAKGYGEYANCIQQRNAYETAFYQQVWHKYAFDGIICPVQAMPQLPNGGATDFSPLAAATLLYNVLDSPVGVVPVTWVDPEKDKLTDEWLVKKNSEGSSFMEDQLYRRKKPFYDPVPMKDMPITVQVVGKRWDEEKVIAMMNIVDKALGDRGSGPGAYLAVCWSTLSL
ncbi:amidase signature domain-containing protein [Mucidula mucida]|nr:amidase signature domain-containing protein [Mucidula mucida]